MRKKPDFILRGKPGYTDKTVSRPFKWAPGIPSLAIRFDEIPGESAAKQEGEDITGLVLGTQDFVAIVTQQDFMIAVSLP